MPDLRRPEGQQILNQLVWCLSNFCWNEGELLYCLGHGYADFKCWILELEALIRLSGYELD